MGSELRFLILILVLLAIDYYGFQAIKTVSSGWNSIARWGFFLLYWALPVLAIILIIFSSIIPILSSQVIIYLRAIVFIGYISKFLMLIPLVIEDLIRLINYGIQKSSGSEEFSNSRKKFISQVSVGIAALPIITLLYGMLGNQYRFRVLRKDIAVKDLPDGLENLKIVQISDIHSGTFAFKEPVKPAVDMVNSLDPDIVVFTGDLVNSRADEALRFLDIFRKINSKYGIYSIMGNHDYSDYYDWPSQEAKRENDELFKDIHKQLGWDLLLNENRTIKINGSEISLIGVENYSALPQFPKYGDLDKAMVNAGGELKVLLSHDPTHWDEEVRKKYPEIALTLSGHTHGFQFGLEVPGYIRWSPSQYVYEQWAGLYKKEDQYLYVNRGLGALAYPGRVGILPEITELTLKKA